MRTELDPQVTAHIIEILGYGQLTIGDFKPAEQSPSFDAVMEMIADMMDRLLTPEDRGNSEASKAVIRQVVATARARFAEMKPRRTL